MTKQNYIVSYFIYDDRNNLIKEGKARLKNKYSELDAKISSETNLRKLYSNMSRLVITSCVTENPFNDLFGGQFNNPFNFFNQ